MASIARESQELIDYIAEINDKAEGEFEITTDLDYWHGCGIATKADLADYLNKCIENDDGLSVFLLAFACQTGIRAIMKRTNSED